MSKKSESYSSCICDTTLYFTLHVVLLPSDLFLLTLNVNFQRKNQTSCWNYSRQSDQIQSGRSGVPGQVGTLLLLSIMSRSAPIQSGWSAQIINEAVGGSFPRWQSAGARR
jgi:hypothetical protein